MPGKNIYKDYIPDTYYHIYNRGVGGAKIFRENSDYAVFLNLLKRYLGKDQTKNSQMLPYPSYREMLELLAFCLMPNHFHLMVYQCDKDGMRMLMKSVGVAYGMYFNWKYKRVGPVFQQRYKAVAIDSDKYLLHISRYLHLNPANHLSWEWSSLPYYSGKYKADWIQPGRVLSLFDGEDYLKFIDDYNARRDDLGSIKTQLANDVI